MPLNIALLGLLLLPVASLLGTYLGFSLCRYLGWWIK